MAKFLSGRQNKLYVGVTSSTESKTVLQVTGKVGIGTTTATSRSLYVIGDAEITGVTTLASAGGITTTGGDLYVGGNLFAPRNASLNELVVNDINVSGVATIFSLVGTGGTINNFRSNFSNIGVATVNILNTGIGTVNNLNSTQLNVSGVGSIATFYSPSAYINVGLVTDISGTRLNYTGVGTITTFISNTGTINNLTSNFNNTGVGTVNILNTGIGTITNLNNTFLNVSGLATVTNLTGTGATIGRIVSAGTSFSQLQVSGISTFTNGPVFIGSGTTTGTASQRLQVTGGAYVSGSVGIGTTNPRETLDVIGTVGVQASGASNRFEILHNASLNSLDFIFI